MLGSSAFGRSNSPADEISDGFIDFVSIIVVFDYISEFMYCILPDSNFCPFVWSTHASSSNPMIANDVERFHRTNNSQFNTAYPYNV